MLKNKIPPPVVGGAMALLIFSINHFVPSMNVEFSILRALVYPLLIIGLSIELWSVGLFLLARTTVNPLKPERSNQLVTNGMYRFSRNPMYLGMSMLLLGLVCWLGTPLGLFAVGAFVWYITLFQIQPEEEALTHKFGEQYIQYRNTVRRWI